MLVLVWSPKGGVGTSVVAAAIAETLSRNHRGVRLIDLDGDQPAICGVQHGADLGIGDLLASRVPVSNAALDQLCCEVDSRFELIRCGANGRTTREGYSPDRLDALAVALFASPMINVVDAATWTGAVDRLLDRAACSLVVVRPCYLTLQRCLSTVGLLERSSNIVLIDDTHSALTARDVERVFDRRVTATLTDDPLVQRCVDAGILLRRRPDALFAPVARLCTRLGFDASRQGAA